MTILARELQTDKAFFNASQFWPTQYDWPSWRKTRPLFMSQPLWLCWEMAKWVAGWEDGVYLLGTMLSSCIRRVLFPWLSYHEKTVLFVLQGNWGSETFVNLSKISHLRSSGTWLQMWRLYSCPLCSTTSPSFCCFPRQEAIQSHSPLNIFCLTDFSSDHQITHTRCL